MPKPLNNTLAQNVSVVLIRHISSHLTMLTYSELCINKTISNFYFVRKYCSQSSRFFANDCHFKLEFSNNCLM